MKYKHRLGQNFIYDKNLLNSLIDDTTLTSEDIVLEIGAGEGTLSEVLAKRAKRVYSFEIDLDLKEKLESVQANFNNLTFIFEDFMTVDLEKFLNKIGAEKIKVVANIPYYITTPIIFKLNKFRCKIESMYFMVQK